MKFLGKIVAIFILLFIGLLIIVPSGGSQPQSVKAAYLVMNRYSRELETTKEMYRDGDGGMLVPTIKKTNMSFYTLKELDIDATRKLYVEVVEGFLKEINSEERVRQHLDKYPYDYRGTDIMIAFVDKFLLRVDHKYIQLVHLTNGSIYYKSGTDLNVNYQTIHKEPYEEALRIVREQAAQQEKE